MDFVPQLALDIRLDAGASFDGFYPGANAQALAAARAVADGGGESFVFLHGASGLGKSHLLQAACRQVGDAGAAAAYLPLADAAQWTPEVLQGLDSLALVAVDDLQWLAGRPDWQEAVFHLYNRLRESSGRLLIAADRRPAELGLALPDLVSRLQWGLVLRLQDLDDAQKVDCLRFRAQRRGLDLPVETAQYLLAHYPRELSALLALLDRLDQASLMAQRRLTIPFVKQALEGVG